MSKFKDIKCSVDPLTGKVISNYDMQEVRGYLNSLKLETPFERRSKALSGKPTKGERKFNYQEVINYYQENGKEETMKKFDISRSSLYRITSQPRTVSL